ncbi:MAG TPA: tRNA (guanosine(37)-N1)-methyltransferase TrmD [Guyparkeria sp.]|nr:tRNA (guanosine(37)-N1)-methyltransferase TrmD [Guyparkeria sp.]
MRVSLVTLFPELVEAGNRCGMVRAAIEKDQLSVVCYNPRDWSTDRNRRVDDRPFGGGPGMLLQPGPISGAIDAAVAESGDVRPLVVALSPQGKRLDRQVIAAWAERKQPLVLVCGRYEGFDQRILDSRVDAEYSLGDLVLSGGELAAMVIVDAIARRLPGVVGDAQSVVEDSFEADRLDHAHYTRPPEWEGRGVPQVLSSGDHQRIAAWRAEQAVLITARRRPDLFLQQGPSDKERAALEKHWLPDNEEIQGIQQTRVLTTGGGK